MPDVIRTLDAARELLDQLAAQVPGFSTHRVTNPDGTWYPVVDGGAEALEANYAMQHAGAWFLLEAIDWNTTLLARLADTVTVAGEADDMVGLALIWADSAEADPGTPLFDEQTPAESLARAALRDPTWGSIDPRNWRECDRALALELLPRMAEQMSAEGDTHTQDVDRARVTLLMLEPALPDRRSGRAS